MAHTDDVLSSPEAGARVIRGSLQRVAANVAGIAIGIGTAALLLRHLGVDESGRYVTVLSLVAIIGTAADAGLNLTGGRDLATYDATQGRVLIANFLGLRLMIAPVGLILLVAFALVAGYPPRMVAGTALAGTGFFIVSIADAALLRLTVELRPGGLAFVDLLRQVVTLVGVAALAAVGARLTPFFAVQIAAGVCVVAITPRLVGPGAFPRPRFDRVEQRRLLTKGLPVAAAIVLGQIYFRLVMVLMSLISSPRQTGYFGGGLRAMESLVVIPVLVAGVALPLLATAARDDHVRLRYAIQGLGEGAVIAGVLVVIVTVRAAEPVMALIGGPSFRPTGAVLRIQVGSLLFIALQAIWSVSLIALGRERDLILANALAVIGLAAAAAALVPAFGALGAAAASVGGDALLASLIYWRLRRAAGPIVIRLAVLLRVLAAAALAALALLIPGLPDLAAAALAGAVFLGTGWAIGMVPDEVRAALGPRGLLAHAGGN
jgi:O-antigen/teichoic acid export membrane protein